MAEDGAKVHPAFVQILVNRFSQAGDAEGLQDAVAFGRAHVSVLAVGLMVQWDFEVGQ